MTEQATTPARVSLCTVSERDDILRAALEAERFDMRGRTAKQCQDDLMAAAHRVFAEFSVGNPVNQEELEDVFCAWMNKRRAFFVPVPVPGANQV